MELPTGWIGRPHDNYYELTWSAATTHKLLLELDRQILVVITDPRSVEYDATTLAILGAVNVTVDRQGYGDMTPHVEVHGPGAVHFVGQGADHLGD